MLGSWAKKLLPNIPGGNAPPGGNNSSGSRRGSQGNSFNPPPRSQAPGGGGGGPAQEPMAQLLQGMGFQPAAIKRALELRSGIEGALQLLVEDSSSTKGPRAQPAGVAPGSEEPIGAWQYEESHGVWQPYDGEAAARLTEAYLAGLEDCALVHGEHGASGGWVVDFEAMQQSRLDGKARVRAVRGSVDGQAAKPLTQRRAAEQGTLPAPAMPAAPPLLSQGSLRGIAGEKISKPSLDPEAAAASTGLEVLPIVGFEWADKKGWHPYSSDVAALISDGLKAEKQVITVQIEGRSYEISLNDMLQVNLATGAKRHVRAVTKRSELTGPVAETGTVEVWEWRQEVIGEDEELWVAYHEAAQAQLTAARRARAKEAEVLGNNGVRYLVDLAGMRQVSLTHNSARPVRLQTISKEELAGKKASPNEAPRGPRGIAWPDEEFLDGMWQRSLGDGRWEAFEAGEARRLESAFVSHEPQGVDLARGSELILVDFDTLEWRNAATEERGMVRRAPVREPRFKFGFSEPPGADEVDREWKEACKSSKPFEDPAFYGIPALFKVEPKSVPVAGWLRYDKVKGLGKGTILLSDDVRPRDVAQGGIGDCWIVSVLALLADNPKLLRQLLVTESLNRSGAYVVRLCHAGSWRHILIDDQLPCRRDQSLVYTSCRNKQLWAPLIEKAYAKLNGSYEALIAGRMYEAMGVLTGYLCDHVHLEEMPKLAAWEYVRAMLDSNFLLCTGSKAGIDPARAKQMGLVSGHAYSLLSAYEAGDEEGGHKMVKSLSKLALEDGGEETNEKEWKSKLRLIELRNPHGRGVWKGPWSDDHGAWAMPGAPKKLRHDGSKQNPPTGRFWMSFDDFLFWYGSIQYCKVRPETWGDERLDVSLMQPTLVANRARALRFSIKKGTTTIELAMLQVGGRGRGAMQGSVDMGFVLLRAVQKGKSKAKGMEVVEINREAFELVGAAPRRQKGCVSLEIDQLEPGDYVAVPTVAAGRRAARPSTSQDRATLVLYARPPVEQVVRLSSLPAPALLRDMLILQACQAGTLDSSTGEGGELRTLKEPCGVTVVAQNRSSKFPMRVSMWAEESVRVEPSRGVLKTLDVVPPNSVQILQILTFSAQHGGAKSLKWSTRTRAEAPGCVVEHRPAVTDALHEVLRLR